MSKLHRLEDYICENTDNFYRFALSYTKNPTDAEDVVSESIVKALKSANTLRDETYIKSWFYRIIINTYFNLCKKKKTVSLDAEPTLLNYEGKEDIYEDTDLKTVIYSLDDKYRSVVLLRFFEDFSIKDIAITLNLNENTVKTRLYKAIKILRLEFDKYE